MLIPLSLFVSGLNPGNHKQQAIELTTRLEEQGYTVQQGTYEYFTQERCHEIEHCYATNPATPYGLPFLPAGPDEDISTHSHWGDFLVTQVDGVNMSANYRLAVGETIVMLGQTPPRCLYYSYVPYVYDRWYPHGWSSSSSDLVLKCRFVVDTNGTRCKIFASLGNPINMLHMNTSGVDGESFNSAFAHFMGGDMAEVEKVQKMGIEAGIHSSIHNTFGLSTERVNLGLTPTSDGFLHFFRFTFAENSSEAREYVYNATNYITILRVTPATGADQGPGFPPYQFNQRISEPEGVDAEGISNKRLRRALKMLELSVKEKYRQTYPFVNKIALDAPTFENGYDCMDQGMHCYIDNQDTLFPCTENSTHNDINCIRGKKCPIPERMTLQDDGNDFFIVVGVNHNATERALYSSIVAYNGMRMESIGGFSSVPMDLDSHSYVGSAIEYRDCDISKYLFAVKITRKCTANETFCLEVPKSGVGSLPLHTSCVFIERIYLDHMKVGPSKNATIKPTVYHFSSKLY